jgi:GTPase involved in cell partitioning and DNA repair
MNIQDNFCKSFSFTAIILALLATDIHADDIEVLQQQCAEIGFTIKTPDNGKCVLKLLKKINGITANKYNAEAQNNSIEAAQKRTEERQQNYAKDADRLQRERMNQQQQEMLELQRRSVAAQENQAQAQRISNIQNMIQPYTAPRKQINCQSIGTFTSCQ